jgi:hypothetical protein
MFWSSVEQSLSRESTTCAATQQLPSILLNSKIHYRARNSPPPAPRMSQNSGVNTTANILVFLVLFSHQY